MTFTIRTQKPTKNNKYYIRKAEGGYSSAIKGKPTDKECNVLSNCVGYAYGRFNEIGQYGYCKHLRPVNAENFIKYKGECEVGAVPQVGACIVWSKGKVGNSKDGAGHVAIVERVVSDNEIWTSESNYGGTAFVYKQRLNTNGNWGLKSPFKFLGFIYQPDVNNKPLGKILLGNGTWNIRAGCSTDYEKVDSLEGGQWVDYYDIDGKSGWYRLNRGWISNTAPDNIVLYSFTIDDALRCFKIVSGEILPTDRDIYRYDVDKNGVINMDDSLEIFRIVSGT